MKYAFKRITALIITLLLVSLLIFAAFNLIPGDPASLILGTNATPQAIAALRHTLGLDQSMPLRYLGWLKGLLTGNFGMSLKYSVPVSGLISSRLPVTAFLALFSLILIAVIAFPVGILCANKRGGALDRLMNAFTMFSISIPGFFLGIIFIWLFGLVLKIFEAGGYVDYSEDFGGFLSYLFFPALAVALPNAATVVKFLRSSLFTQLDSDYIRTALSRGNSYGSAILRHALKNALVPVITLSGMIIAEVFSGSIITEQVFGLPGIGRLLISGVSSRDFPLVEALVMYIAFAVISANFLVDVLLRAVDPRIRVD